MSPTGPSSAPTPVIAEDIARILARDLPWERLFGTTVLVTGASGMLPSYALHTLLALNDERDAGIRVRALVRNERKARAALAGALARDDVRLIVQDVSDPLELDALDLVIHGASAARPALHSSDPVATMKANLLGTINLLDLCVAHDAGFVLMSSAEVYGAQPEGTTLIPENSYGGFDILNPRACYSEGKRAAETLCAVYLAQHGTRCTIARFGHIYGPGLALDDGRVQADFAADVIAGRDILLNSDGSAVRTYTYVADAVAGMFTALLRGESTAYNVSDSAGLVSIRDLARAFVAARPAKGLELRFGPSVDVSAYNPSKHQGLDGGRLGALGWTAQVPLDDGIDRFLRHFEWLENTDGDSTNAGAAT